jgi:hypothetical protein
MAGMLSKEQASRRLIVPEHVCVQALGEELVLLNINTGYYFGLDERGKAFFEALTSGATVEAALGRLEAAYEAPAERLGTDLLELLDKLERHGLVSGDAS